MGRTGGPYRRPYRQQAILSHPPLHYAAIPSPLVLSCPFLSPLAASPLLSSPRLLFRCLCEQQGMACWLIFSVAVSGSQLSVVGYIHTYIPVNRSTLYDASGRDVDGWACEQLQRWKRWGWRSWTLRSGQVRPAATRRSLSTASVVGCHKKVGPGSRMYCATPVIFVPLNLPSPSLPRTSYHACISGVCLFRRVRFTAAANLKSAAVPLARLGKEHRVRLSWGHRDIIAAPQRRHV